VSYLYKRGDTVFHYDEECNRIRTLTIRHQMSGWDEDDWEYYNCTGVDYEDGDGDDIWEVSQRDIFPTHEEAQQRHLTVSDRKVSNSMDDTSKLKAENKLLRTQLGISHHIPIDIDFSDITIEAESTLSDCWKWITTARKRNAPHRKRNISMGDVDSIHLVARAAEELGEVSQAITRDGNQQEELADLFAVLMQLCLEEGFKEDDIASRMLTKLKDIFGVNE